MSRWGDRGERYRSLVNRQDKPSDPGWPRPGLHGVGLGRGSSLGAETSRRRGTDTTGSPRCPRWIRRLMLVIAALARTGAIMSVAAASARGSTAGRRSGAGAGDQVTVTDSHHPALRMAPAASSRRQCPRDSWTCCRRPWLARGREWPEGSRIGPLCAGHLAVATLARLGSRSRPDRVHGVGAVRVVAGILAARAAGDPCESGQGLGRSGLTQDYATFVLCQAIRGPLCPLSRPV